MNVIQCVYSPLFYNVCPRRCCLLESYADESGILGKGTYLVEELLQGRQLLFQGVAKRNRLSGPRDACAFNLLLDAQSSVHFIMFGCTGMCRVLPPECSPVPRAMDGGCGGRQEVCLSGGLWGEKEHWVGLSTAQRVQGDGGGWGGMDVSAGGDSSYRPESCTRGAGDSRGRESFNEAR